MGIDVVTLALAKGYTDGKIRDAVFGDVPLDTSLTKKGQAADAKAVGDALESKIDESDVATDDEIIEMLTQEDMLPVVADFDGALLSDENGDILLW